MFECPSELEYSQRHLWLKKDEDSSIAEVGVTEDLIEQLDEIISIDMPMVHDELELDQFCVHMHIHTDIYHLRAPLTGRVTEINKDVLDNPNLLHVAPYRHWLYRMEYDEPHEFELLMNATQYIRFIDSDHVPKD